MTKLHTLVGNLQQHLQKSQDNIAEIKSVLKPYARKPLFERKEGRRDAILCVDERDERTARRYAEMRKIATQIENLLQHNMQLFEMEDKQNDPKWMKYIEFVDGIVLNYLFQTVGCRYTINTCIVLIPQYLIAFISVSVISTNTWTRLTTYPRYSRHN